MLDDILAEIVERVGGVNALAAELRVTSQAIHKWRQFGIPESRVNELEKISGVPREKIRRYSQRKQTERRAGLEWWEPTSSRSEHHEPREPRPQTPPSPESIRAMWHMHDAYPQWRDRDSPPPYPRPPPPPAPPPLPDEVASIIDSAELSHRALLTTFARFLQLGTVDGPYDAYFLKSGPDAFHWILRTRFGINAAGCLYSPRTIEHYRAIATQLGATEQGIDGNPVFFRREVTLLQPPPLERCPHCGDEFVPSPAGICPRCGCVLDDRDQRRQVGGNPLGGDYCP
jgi:hypothetical protein